jgi:hypothetical protein
MPCEAAPPLALPSEAMQRSVPLALLPPLESCERTPPLALPAGRAYGSSDPLQHMLPLE